MTAELATSQAPEVAELDVLGSLLEPIAGESPTGVSVRYEPIFDQIREARRDEDATLPQGVWKRDLKQSDWPKVAELCIEVLSRRSKDLLVAVWLLEAWTHERGLAGARLGLQLLHGLSEKYWDDLFPQIDDGDIGGRVAPIELINQRATQLLKATQLTSSKGVDGIEYSWLEWESGGSPTGEGGDESKRAAILAAVSMTPLDHYRRIESQASGALEDAKLLSELLLERCGSRDCPSLSEFSTALEGMSAFAHRIVKEREPMEQPDPQPAGQEAEQDGSMPSSSAADGPPSGLERTGRVTSRSEAYYLLTLAADYLQATEPHSPAPFLVRRAITWGGMSLVDLLRELLANNADLDTVYTLLGVDPNDH